MAKVLDSGLEVNEFELQLCCYVLFQTDTLGESYDSFIPTSCHNCVLNIITAVLLQGWLWHQITQEGWYATEQRNLK